MLQGFGGDFEKVVSQPVPDENGPSQQHHPIAGIWRAYSGHGVWGDRLIVKVFGYDFFDEHNLIQEVRLNL